jgi:hypothetical protein
MHSEHSNATSAIERLSLLRPLNVTPSPTVDVPFDADDWRILYHTVANSLLVGSLATVNAAVSLLLPRLQEPIFTWDPSILSEPSLPSTGTLVIREVAELGSLPQQRLLDHLNNLAHRVRVISLASSPLYPFVQRGDFLEALFYRLNVVCLHAAH